MAVAYEALPTVQASTGVWRPRIALWAALGSLFLSGAASLMAQTVIQRYISTVFGGMDAVIMAVVSFSFLAGIGAGTLWAARLTRTRYSPALMWAIVEFVCAGGVFVFIGAFGAIHNRMMPWVSAAAPGQVYLLYYGYVLGMQFFSSFLIATLMGMNYPFALATLTRSLPIPANRLALMIIAVNTFGAALGSFGAPRLMAHTDLCQIAQLAAAAYLLAGTVVLYLPRWQASAGPTTARVESMKRPLAARVGYGLLFVGGAAGFSFEVVVFRHFSLSNTGDHTVFGTALGLYLVFWALGTVMAQVGGRSLKTVTTLFVVTLATSSVMLFVGRVVHHVHFDLADYKSFPLLAVFFLPALASGWLFSQVHKESGDLTVAQLARLYFANLAGSFIGGVLTKYCLPWLLSFTYSLLLWSLVLAVCVCLLSSSRRSAILTAAGGLAFLLGLACFSPHLRYYRSFVPPAEKLLEVKEDWATASWLTNANFVVGNRSQLCYPEQPFYGYRLFQVAIAMRLKKHADIFIAGTALGTANGAIGRFLPDSRIVNVDYSPSVRYFANKYANLNYHLLEQQNSVLHTTDARLQLSLEQKPFDVVLEFAEHEGVPGISTIKSIEFLRIVKKKLRPGGVYVGLGHTVQFIATVQKVFKNVYKIKGYPFVVGSDEQFEDLIDNNALVAVSKKDAQLRKRLMDPDNAVEVVKMPPLAGRIVTDTDPCADYRELRIEVDDEAGDGAPLLLPRLTPDQ